MADKLMDPDLFTTESVQSQKKAEAFNSNVSRRQDQQQVTQALGTNTGTNTGNRRVQITSPIPASAPSSGIPGVKAMTLGEVRASAASFAKEREAEEQAQYQAVLKTLEKHHAVYRLEKKHKNGPKNLSEALEELQYTTLQLNKVKGMGLVNTCYFGAMNLVEWVATYRWNPLGVDLKGLGSAVQRHEAEIAPVLVDIAVKYNLMFEANPLFQLAVMTGGIIKEVHAENARGPKSMYSSAPDISGFTSQLGI